jgi:hypothetical protein
MSVSSGSLRAMNVEIPLFVLKLSGFLKPRYLVLQVEVRGLANTPTIVYAQLFYSRSHAEKAVKAADDRIRIKIGNRTIGSRRAALLATLPIDDR